MNAYQIKIALRGVKPIVWRRVLIPADLPMADFHKIIQTTMGWENYHLHQFVKNKIYYSVRMEDDGMWGERDIVDYTDMKVSDLLKTEKETVLYEYDFGDGWSHDIILEKILPFDGKIEYPVCTAGKMCCPPEDCGGIWGYDDMLKILKRPKDVAYKNYLEWLGGEFDPKYFNIEEVNEFLREEDYGCIPLDMSPTTYNSSKTDN